ncbi:hypothetical protein V8F20_008205 [Naviculisporaceae sp. PSN 640]
MAQENEDNPVIFDRDGDLTLVVGSGKQKALVCSRALSRASLVFEKMLNGPFRESNPNRGHIGETRAWAVELPDDEWQAVEIMLSIWHGSVHLVPHSLDLETLYSLLVFADKYDMTRSLAPWAKTWQPSHHHHRNAGALTSVGVAWGLGNELALGCLELHFRQKCSIDSEGRLLGPETNKPIDEVAAPLIPEGFFEHIKATRAELVAKALKCVRKTIFRRGIRQVGSGSKPACYCSYQRSTDGSNDTRNICHDATLGRIIRVLGDTQLLPYLLDDTSPEKLPYKGSLDSLINDLSKINTHDIPLKLHLKARRSSPESCNPMPTLVRKIRGWTSKDSNSCLTDQMRERMAEQRRRLGFTS